MRRRAAWLCPFLLATAVIGGAIDARAECSTVGLPDGRKVAELQTTAGELCIELLDDVDEAPRHVENFLYYLESDLLAGTFFHRFVPDFVMQGAQYFADGDDRVVPPREGVVVVNEPCMIDPAQGICLERGNDEYTVALAKRDREPDSGTTSWFINLKDNRTNLDRTNGGFTVFGRLIHPQSFATVDAMTSSFIAETGDHFWARSGFGYEVLTDDGEDTVITLGETPLLVEPVYSGEPYGCLDMLDQATIVIDDALPDLSLDPDDPDAPEPAAHIASAACGTPVSSPATWVKGPGSVGCPEADRLAVRSLSPEPLTALDAQILPAFDFPLEYVSFTCEQLRESDTQRGIWREDFAERFRDGLILIESTTVRVAVPEPGAAASAAAALGCLAWLKRRSDRGRTSV